MTDNDIEVVVSNKDRYFKIDKIKNGTVLLRKKKHWRIPGGLCCVYKYRLQDGSESALRIWKTEISESKKRSNAIAEYLRSLRSPYFVDFEYIEDAFTYNGNLHPVILMDWCDGDKLKKYIYDNVNNPHKIEELASSILSMIYQMHKYGISHGDLQHDNILVKKNGSVVLIDYDTMYVPQLRGYKDESGGYPGYQHPSARQKNKILSPKVDYFSELILYLSIQAIAQNTSLLTKYLVEEQDKSMLFTMYDFDNLRSSKIYKDVKKLGGKFKILLDILELYLSKNDINDLEPFYVIAQRMGLELPESTIIEIETDTNSILKRWGTGTKETDTNDSKKTVSLFCTKCSKRFSDRDNYCINCGKERSQLKI